MLNYSSIDDIDVDALETNSIHKFWLNLITNGLGDKIKIPIIIAVGKKRSPIIGLTAAVHGNELNGISVIQRLMHQIDPSELNGTIISIPVVNIPSYLNGVRLFKEGYDLNRIMPGKQNGDVADVYAFRFVNKVIKKLDYLLDLHTASFGRINSFYIRSDMSNPKTRQLALLQNADIIVHNPPSDGTLRGAAEELKIPAITIEVGNPSGFQKKIIKSGLEGIHNVLSYLHFIPDQVEPSNKNTVVCSKSYWIYTDLGGLLTVHCELRQHLKEGEHIATLRNIFGDVIKEFYAPQDGIVIGKSINPVNQSGGRILHLGIIE